MKSGKGKLLSAALLLVVSLVMLVSASLAWFTVSENPEIGGMQVDVYTDMALLVSAKENGDYVQAVSLGDKLRYYAPLKPVSTSDGENWFLPTYTTSTGQLNNPAEFTLDDDLTHANVSLYDYNQATGAYTKKTGVQLYNAQRDGYYVYTDIWLKTEQAEGCSVTLSVPANVSGLDTWETDQGLYGSYALACYETTGDGIAAIDNNAQTALRVGFLTESNGFIIYEPNAEQRSDASGKPSEGQQAYISGYTLGADRANYHDGYYIPTRPVALSGAGTGEITEIPNIRLIIQKASAWNLGKLQAALEAGKAPNSTHIDSFGLFVSDNAALATNVQTGMAVITAANLAAASQTMIVSLEQNVPQKVRIFIWLEGQDVDCWNDIAAGSFAVNLEFAAQPN